MIAFIKCLLKQKYWPELYNCILYIGRNKTNVYCSLCVEMIFFVYSEIHDFFQGRIRNIF